MKIVNEYKIYKMEEITDDENKLSDDSIEDGDDFFDDEFANEFSDELGDSDGSEESEDFNLDSDDQIDDEQTNGDFAEEDLEDLDTDSDGEDADEFSDEFSDELDDSSDEEIGDLDLEDGEGEDIEDEPEGNKTYQGNVRTIPGAFLVYKKQAEDSTYEELWLYNVGKDIKQEMKIRRAILDGTDISPQTQRSADNKQTAKIVSFGNIQYLNIFGLPN